MDILRKQGLDPEKNYTITDYMPGFIGGATTTSTKPMIDIYMEAQVSPLPFFVRDNPATLKMLPNLDDAFERKFLDYVSETSAQLSIDCLRILSRHGVQETDKADMIPVRITQTVRHSGSIFISHPKSNRGYVLKVHTKHAVKYFAVSAKHCDIVVPLRADPGARSKWLEANLDLFFDGAVLARAHKPRFDQPTLRNISVHTAIVHGNAQTFEEALLSVKSFAFEETDFEKVFHFARGVLIPGYDAAREASKGNYEEAVLSAGLDLLDVAFSATQKAGKLKKLGKLLPSEIDDISALRKLDDVFPGAPPANAATTSLEKKARIDRVEKFKKVEDTAVVARSEKAFLSEAENEIQKLNRLVRAEKKIRNYCLHPSERCEAVLEPLLSLLKDAGYKTKVRGMYFWSNAKTDMPKNHFAVLASKDGVDYVVDISAGQFSEFDITEPIVATDEMWQRTYRDAAQRTLIKYKDYKSIAAAGNEFSTTRSVLPTDEIPAAKILAEPAWYKKVANTNRAAASFRSPFAEDDTATSFRASQTLGVLATLRRPTAQLSHTKRTR